MIVKTKISAEIVRFLFATMLCIANMIIYGLKVNISTAIIGMVKSKGNYTGGSASNECPMYEESNSTTPADVDGPYEWSATQQGLVVSLYFAGYLIGMFPAGYFADRLVNLFNNLFLKQTEQIKVIIFFIY